MGRSAQFGGVSVTAELKTDSDSPKHQLVLDAAAALFMAHGYGAVSMDAVARAAGVSKATLYAHFASKDALFATIVGDGCRAKMVATDYLAKAPVGGAAGLAETLRVFGTHMMRFLMQPDTQSIYRIVVSESSRFP